MWMTDFWIFNRRPPCRNDEFLLLNVWLTFCSSFTSHVRFVMKCFQIGIVFMTIVMALVLKSDDCHEHNRKHLCACLHQSWLEISLWQEGTSSLISEHLGQNLVLHQLPGLFAFFLKLQCCDLIGAHSFMLAHELHSCACWGCTECVAPHQQGCCLVAFILMLAAIGKGDQSSELVQNKMLLHMRRNPNWPWIVFDTVHSASF